MTKRVLIIGGTGVFGKRLVRHLSSDSGVFVYLSSRSLSKAQAVACSLSNAATSIIPIELDCQVNLKQVLDDVRPFAVVDCSGPFQTADYNTAQAVLQSGAHLVDLADARGYLAGFVKALNETALNYDVAALTGASSTPTLSTAVALEIAGRWRRVDSIDICITPGGKSEVGRSVIEAILSYAGKTVPVWRGGQLSTAIGWLDGAAVNVPGLGSRRVAAVETFDAEYLGPKLNVQSRVTFSAGLESRIEQLGIESLAALRRRRWLGSLKPLIPLLLKARKVTRLTTSASGGMLVDIRGVDGDGIETQTRWSLVADRDHGPFIPILPAAAAIRKLMRGEVAPGASMAHQAVRLTDILDEMSPYAIRTKTSERKSKQSLFGKALGAAEFEALPSAVRKFHSPAAPALWTGEADIECGKWFGPKLLAWFFGFPRAGRNVPVTVSIDRFIDRLDRQTEIWTRQFGDAVMKSELRHLGHRRVSEKFQPFSFELALDREGGEVHMPVKAWRLGSLQLPRLLAPKSQTREYMADDERFHFDVRLSAPILGLVVHYRGWLQPDHEAPVDLDRYRKR